MGQGSLYGIFGAKSVMSYGSAKCILVNVINIAKYVNVSKGFIIEIVNYVNFPREDMRLVIVTVASHIVSYKIFLAVYKLLAAKNTDRLSRLTLHSHKELTRDLFAEINEISASG